MVRQAQLVKTVVRHMSPRLSDMKIVGVNHHTADQLTHILKISNITKLR